MKEMMRSYGSSSGALYELYDFDDTIVVTLRGVCDIMDDYAELIETHERNTHGTDNGKSGSEETVGA